MKPPTSRSTLFPYTTLFRSAVGVRGCLCGRSQEQGAEDGAAQDRAEPGERAGHGGPFRRKIENVLFLRVGGLGVCPAAPCAPTWFGRGSGAATLSRPLPMLALVGALIDLSAVRAGRAARLAAAALHARMHPALRWHVDEDTSAAHRRTPMGRAACGQVGRLRVADPATPLCPACYPAALPAQRRA